MKDEIKPTIVYCEKHIVHNDDSAYTKVMKTLNVAKAVMTTVIIYSYFVKAVDYLKNNKNVGNINKNEKVNLE